MIERKLFLNSQRQDLFDRALAGLRLQGKKSISEETGECCYRSPDGCRCAIGWLIPDKQYNPSFEGQSADNYFIRESVGAHYENEVFLWHLQARLHDDVYSTNFLDALETAAKKFARSYDLTYTPPEGARA